MHTDWIWGLAGGAMIGGGATLWLTMFGRTMGASGIIAGLISREGHGLRLERLAFVLGLVLMPLALTAFGATGATHLTARVPVILAGGLLVGLGTRLAGGCTSGHGVCGISRLSPRGLAATALYVGSGMATVLMARVISGGA